MAVRRRVAVVGGGIAGLAATWQLARDGAADAVLFEACHRLGGTVQTVRRDGFVVECGPDAWVTEKPWARELAGELGLEDELMVSNDAERVTYIVRGGRLVAMPDGMRMMVPGNLGAIEGSELFSEAAKRAYLGEPGRADELRAAAPAVDESVANFCSRHFGAEVLQTVAAPLLSGVFGGDVGKLSVRAVMPAFVAMEREHGSLVAAVQARGSNAAGPVFTTLRSGVGTLVERLIAGVPAKWVRMGTAVRAVSRDAEGWVVDGERFDAVMLAVPAHVARELLAGLDPRMVPLLPVEASSAVVVSFCFTESFSVPKGFGFLVPVAEGRKLMACTFADGKFAGRVPEGGRLLRAFFGGDAAEELMGASDEEIARVGLAELTALMGKMPEPAFSVVRRWPRSLPQYFVGHGERMAALDGLVGEWPGLSLLGNAYRGVGLPDLVRDGRAAAKGCQRWANAS